MGVYTTVADVRAEPEVGAANPPTDATIESYITQAEDQLDVWLGGWPVQTTGPSAGRKIVQINVDGWRWTKLNRAATRLAARLYADPSLLQGPRYASVSGPDFSKSQPAPTLRRLMDVVAPLNASGLRQLGARAIA